MSRHVASFEHECVASKGRCEGLAWSWMCSGLEAGRSSRTAAWPHQQRRLSTIIGVPVEGLRAGEPSLSRHERVGRRGFGHTFRTSQ